jgi:hypothetical protein
MRSNYATRLSRIVRFAEEMNRRALDGREKALGKEHPDTLTSVNSLALVLERQGKYEAAEEMNRQALHGREKALGKEHPDTLTSVNDLARVLQCQGKYEAAEDRRALDGREKASALMLSLRLAYVAAKPTGHAPQTRHIILV